MKKIFILGEEWLYYKVYCGTRIANVILQYVVGPFTISLMEQNLISKWFFIRYEDPDHHLRIRIKLSKIEYLGTIIKKFKQRNVPFVNDN